MMPQEAAISFKELFAYTDYLASRWFGYFNEHEAALEIEVGGQTGTLRQLVEHIVQVEEFFANRLLGQQAPQSRPAPRGLAELLEMHTDVNRKFGAFLKGCDHEKLHATQTFASKRVSNRKILAQAALHSVHHWAQVAMEVRQAGFPSSKPQDIIISDVME